MLIIGIAGGTGSGKTTVVRKIVEQLPQGEVAVMAQDSYYRDSGHPALRALMDLRVGDEPCRRYFVVMKKL